MTEEQLTALVRRQAEEAFPDRTFNTGTWSGKGVQMHFHNERTAFTAGRLPVLRALVEAKGFMDHPPDCFYLIPVKSETDPNFIEWQRREADGGACSCGLSALLATIDELVQ